MFHRYTNTELIEQIRNGNKNTLLYLYNLHYKTVRKFIIKNGGNKEDVDALLQDVLVKAWTEVNKPEFDKQTDIKNYLLELIRVQWINRHDEADVRNYIVHRFYVKNRWKNITAFVLGGILIAGIAFWWYFDPQPFGIFNNYKPEVVIADTADTAAVKKENSRKKAVRQEQSKERKDNSMTDAAKQDSGLIMNDSLQNILVENQEEHTITTTINLPETDEGGIDEIVVKKDVLQLIRVVKVIEKKNDVTEKNVQPNTEKSLAQETADKLNPGAKLPVNEEQKEKSFIVEFWKSPVNYHGYKIGKNKIVAFGIEEPELLKLFSFENNIVMEYGGNYYVLEKSNEFQPFVKFNDAAVISQLKK